jgi:hypothetical protein
MIAERPFVTKEEILRAYDPSGRAHEAAFRRLRREGVVSDGIRLRPRYKGRIAGTLTAYSTFNRDAVVAYRKDARKALRSFKAAARAFETSAAANVFATFGSGKSAHAPTVDRLMNDFSATHAEDLRRIFTELHATRKHLNDSMNAAGLAAVVGVVSGVHDNLAELVSDEGLRYTLRRSALATSRLDKTGAAVTVWTEDLGPGGLFTLVDSALSSAENTEPAARPFDDERPPLPENLDELLDRALAGSSPINLTGPLPAA